MIKPTPDQRTESRKINDERIAAETPLAAPALPSNGTPLPIEAHLSRRHRPVAIEGVVENGLVRPLDPDVKLAERARVIIVAAQ